MPENTSKYSKDLFKRLIGAAESGGRHVDSKGNLIRNPKGSASGKYQIIDETWNNVTRGKKPSTGGRWNKNNPQHNEEVMNLLLNNYENVLSRRGLPVNATTMYALHLKGNTDWVNAAIKSPGDSYKKYFTPKEIRDNSVYFSGAKNVGDVLSRLNNTIKKKASKLGITQDDINIGTSTQGVYEYTPTQYDRVELDPVNIQSTNSPFVVNVTETDPESLAYKQSLEDKVSYLDYLKKKQEERSEAIKSQLQDRIDERQQFLDDLPTMAVVDTSATPRKLPTAQFGGKINLNKNISINGYKRDSNDVNNSYNVIPGNIITMENVDKSLTLVPIIKGKPDYSKSVSANPGDKDIAFGKEIEAVLELPKGQSGLSIYTYNNLVDQFNSSKGLIGERIPLNKVGQQTNSTDPSEGSFLPSFSTNTTTPLWQLKGLSEDDGNNQSLNIPAWQFSGHHKEDGAGHLSGINPLYNLDSTLGSSLKADPLTSKYSDTPEQQVKNAIKKNLDGYDVSKYANAKFTTTAGTTPTEETTAGKSASDDEKKKRTISNIYKTIPNVYSGVDIEGASVALGSFLGYKPGESNRIGNVSKGLGTIGSIGKIGLGLFRNISTGYAQTKRRQEAINDFIERDAEERRKEGEYNYFDTDRLQKQQKGGTVESKMFTGNYIKGNDEHPNPNVEVESGEYVRTPEGETYEVMGKKHSEGGEKLNLPQGTNVVSDYTRIGKDVAKYVSDTFNISVTAKNSYATVIDRFKKKLGLNKLIEEEEKIYTKVKKVDKMKESTTKKLNKEVLEKKLQKLAEQKAPLEEKLTAFTDVIFSLQEGKKEQARPMGYKQQGGQITDPNYVQELISAYSQATGAPEEEIVAELKKLSPSQQEAAIAQMEKQLQGGQSAQGGQAPQGEQPEQAPQSNILQVIEAYAEKTGKSVHEISELLGNMSPEEREGAIQALRQETGIQEESPEQGGQGGEMDISEEEFQQIVMAYAELKGVSPEEIAQRLAQLDRNSLMQAIRQMQMELSEQQGQGGQGQGQAGAGISREGLNNIIVQYAEAKGVSPEEVAEKLSQLDVNAIMNAVKQMQMELGGGQPAEQGSTPPQAQQGGSIDDEGISQIVSAYSQATGTSEEEIMSALSQMSEEDRMGALKQMYEQLSAGQSSQGSEGMPERINPREILLAYADKNNISVTELEESLSTMSEEEQALSLENMYNELRGVPKSQQGGTVGENKTSFNPDEGYSPTAKRLAELGVYDPYHLSSSLSKVGYGNSDDKFHDPVSAKAIKDKYKGILTFITDPAERKKLEKERDEVLSIKDVNKRRVAMDKSQAYSQGIQTNYLGDTNISKLGLYMSPNKKAIETLLKELNKRKDRSAYTELVEALNKDGIKVTNGKIKGGYYNFKDKYDMRNSAMAKFIQEKTVSDDKELSGIVSKYGYNNLNDGMWDREFLTKHTFDFNSKKDELEFARSKGWEILDKKKGLYVDPKDPNNVITTRIFRDKKVKPEELEKYTNKKDGLFDEDPEYKKMDDEADNIYERWYTEDDPKVEPEKPKEDKTIPIRGDIENSPSYLEGVAQTPDQSNLSPFYVSPGVRTLKGYRVVAPEISPRAHINAIDSQVNVAVQEAYKNNPYTAGALASNLAGRAMSGKAEILSKVDTMNTQSAMQAEQANAQQALNIQNINNNALNQYEDKSLLGLDNWKSEWNNYIDRRNRERVAKFNYQNQVNAINATSDNYHIASNNAIVQTPQKFNYNIAGIDSDGNNIYSTKDEVGNNVLLTEKQRQELLMANKKAEIKALRSVKTPQLPTSKRGGVVGRIRKFRK